MNNLIWETYEFLDPGIQDAVRIMHENGIKTSESCDGSLYHSYSEPTVILAGKLSKKRVLEIVEICYNRLDCFDCGLPELYAEHGFKEVGRYKWNENYAPKDWNKKIFEKFNNGQPDVIYMTLTKEGIP
jgi:predicted nucleic-acid-binding Zn-ribbon protein